MRGASPDVLGAAHTRPAPAADGIGWLRRLWPFVQRYKAPAMLSLSLSIVAQLMIGLLPWMQQQIVDHSITAKERPLVPMIALMLGLTAVGFATNYGRRYLGSKVAVDLQHDIRVAMHRHLYELDFARHDRLSVGDVMSRSAGDLTLLFMFFASVSITFNNLCLLLVAVAVMFVLSPLLSVVMVIFIPVFAFVAVRYRDKVFPATWNDQRLAGEVAGIVDEAVTGVRVVKAFGQEDREFQRMVGRARELYQSRMRTARFNARYSSTLQTLPMLSQLGVLALGGYLALRGHVTLGVFLAFASYLVQIITPVRMVSAMMSVTQQARAGAERLFEVFDMEPDVTDRVGARPVGRAAGAISLDGVGFSYGDGTPALHHIDLTIEPGERVGIVGGSGSGKSTLAYLLARFYDPTEGTVRLDGTDVRDFTLESLRSAVHMVFEDSFLFTTTIGENIAYARPEASPAEIEDAARTAQAHDFISRLREGYDTMVGERGYTLSGGQRQRVALARAAIANPSVLILDDATSAVDAGTEERIHASFDEVAGNRTTILIAHRSSTLRLVDRIIVLDQGRILAQGTHEELLETCPLYEELLTGPTVDDDPSLVLAETSAIAATDPAAWPDEGHRGRRVRRADMSTVLQGLSAGRGAWGPGGFIAATPELLAKVERLPPLRGDPEIDLAEAIERDDQSTLRRLVRRFRAAFVLVGALVVVDAATSLVGPLLVRNGLDHGVAADNARVLVAMCIAYLGVQVVSWLNQIAVQTAAFHAAERMLFSLRARTFAHLQRLALSFYDREQGGRIMTRMTTDVEALSQLLQQGLLVALTSIVGCVGVVAVLLVLDVRLALATLTILPALAVVTVVFKRWSRAAYLEARAAVSSVNAELAESIAGVRVTQSLGRTDNNDARFAAKSWRFRTSRLRSMQLMAMYFAATQLLSTVAKAIVLVVGAHYIDADTLTSGVLIAFLLYVDQFFAPLQQMSAVFDQWFQARVSLNALDGLLRTETTVPLAADPIDPGRVTGDVRFDGVRFAYSADAPEALRGIDLHIPPGQTLALVGTTGAGKSTFVKLAARFYDPTAGRVLIDGNPLVDLDLKRYRRRVGYVPQEPFLFGGTIRSNIVYGKPDASDLEVERAARAVGAHDFIATMPQGYLTEVTEAGRSLSAGQRQLLCLARAVIIDPSILILDEATSNLDLHTEAMVQRAMNRAAYGRTTMLIAHRLQTARTASRIVLVSDGEIVEDGTHAELVELGGRYAELWAAFSHASRPLPARSEAMRASAAD